MTDRMRLRLASLVLAFGGCSSDPMSGQRTLDDLVAVGGDARILQDEAWLRVAVSRATHRPSLLAAREGVLVEDDASRPVEARTRAFLASYGGLVGLSRAERDTLPFTIRNVMAHGDEQIVRVTQQHAGLPVHGAELVVRLGARGIASIGGTWVPDVAVDPTPRLSASDASARAIAKVGSTAKATAASLAILPVGLLRGASPDARLAWSVHVEHEGAAYEVWIDALDGRVHEQLSLHQHAMFRRVRSGGFGHFYAEVANEDDPPNALDPDPIHRIFRFSGQSYAFFASAFGRDSYDGEGRTLNATYRADCAAGAYWQYDVNICAGYAVDDIVAHEWGHAYSQYTHGLQYGYESGALNEAYSDIWGETLDLHNGEDGVGGNANDAPAPQGQRWLLGEDVPSFTRDMCMPERSGYPGYLSAETQDCSGSVANNLSIPGHGYALLVDGSATCASDQNVVPGAPTVIGIGILKAAAIYYRAMTVYQTPTTNFVQHADALEASCADLVGAELTPWVLATAPADGTITVADCAEVSNMIAAIGLRDVAPCVPPPPTEVEPQLSRFIGLDPPPVCADGATTFSESFERGIPSTWTLTSTGWSAKHWTVANALPEGRAGQAAHIPGEAGDCSIDRSGSYAMTTPELTAPNSTATIDVRFTHLFDAEMFRDGGNLLVSVDGGDYRIVPDENITYNAYTPWNLEAADASSNPKADERAWHGRESEPNDEYTKAVWITTVVTLDGLVAPGHTYRLRWDFGQDGCVSFANWYVDDVSITSCPSAAAPTITATQPDALDRFTVSWTRSPLTTGLDTLDESTVCDYVEDCETGFAGWTVVGPWERSSAKPEHASTAFHVPTSTNGPDTYATLTRSVAIPATSRATLRWKQWVSSSEALVEISTDGGAHYQAIHRQYTALAPVLEQNAFQTQPLTERTVDLNEYRGTTVLLRFRIRLGDAFYDNTTLTPHRGWWLDDITVDVEEVWSPIYTGTATSRTLRRATAGAYCYRARNSYADGTPTRWSNTVTVTIP